jgi:hypothetical protein
MVSSSFKSRFNSRSTYSSSTEQGKSSGFWILSIVLIVLIIIAIIAGTYYKTYDKFTNSNVKLYTLQYYCMERCGHCKDFEKNVWNNFSKKINDNPGYYHFDTIKYDITDNGKGTEMGNKYNINSTPTIFLYNKNTQRVYTFDDDRTEEKLFEFANRIIKSDYPGWIFKYD